MKTHTHTYYIQITDTYTFHPPIWLAIYASFDSTGHVCNSATSRLLVSIETRKKKKRLHRNTHTNGVYLRTHTLTHGARRTNCSENADTKNLNSNLIDCRRKQINLYRCATYHSTPRQYGLVIRSIQLTLGFICCPCSSRSLSI